jgi:transcriptional regulator
LIEQFPFAVIAINGTARPVVAQAPLTFRDGLASQGVVDFHLARANIITNAIKDGSEATILVNGPNAHISPSWYTGRFPDSSADRSRTAPTWDYLSATLTGRLRILSLAGLEKQIADLVAHHEPADGWRFEEIDPSVLMSWCDMLVGYRFEIETFDLTAKLSQNQTPADIPGISRGLRLREGLADEAIAQLV